MSSFLDTRLGLINGLNTVLKNADVDAISLVSLSTNLESITAIVDEISHVTATTASAMALSIIKAASDLNAAYTGKLIIIKIFS